MLRQTAPFLEPLRLCGTSPVTGNGSCGSCDRCVQRKPAGTGANPSSSPQADAEAAPLAGLLPPGKAGMPTTYRPARTPLSMGSLCGHQEVRKPSSRCPASAPSSWRRDESRARTGSRTQNTHSSTRQPGCKVQNGLRGSSRGQARQDPHTRNRADPRDWLCNGPPRCTRFAQCSGRCPVRRGVGGPQTIPLPPSTATICPVM
jgi:hypothetical protein